MSSTGPTASLSSHATQLNVFSNRTAWGQAPSMYSPGGLNQKKKLDGNVGSDLLQALDQRYQQDRHAKNRKR